MDEEEETKGLTETNAEAPSGVREGQTLAAAA
jgi:hypothetical protein